MGLTTPADDPVAVPAANAYSVDLIEGDLNLFAVGQVGDRRFKC